MLDSKHTSEVNYSAEDVDLLYFGSAERKMRNPTKAQTNAVSTTRYTPLSWLPLSLLMQFTRLGNIYLLIISVLTLMPFTTKSPAALIGTFSLVLFLSCVKEGIEDFYRHKADREENQKIAHVYSYGTGSYEPRYWKDIGVGELVRLENNEEVPCDIFLLHTTNKGNVAFVDTSQLNG